MRQVRIACSISAVLVSFALFAEKQPFERYQSIIDRQPFGQPPIGFDPTKPPGEMQKGQSEAAAQQELTLDQQQLQKAVGFSVINIEAGGVTMVGFTDNTDPKIPRHYYLPVGETRNGWKVTSADAVKKTATISKDGVEVSLNLGDNAKGAAPGPGGKGGGGLLGRRGIGGFRNNGGNAAPAITGAAGAGTNAGRGGLLGRGGGLLNRGSQSGIDSFRSRRERREAEERQAAAERAEKEAERKRQAEAAAAKEEEEKKAREQERAEQRQQLMAIQEELRKAREEKARREAEMDGSDANDDS